MTCMLVLSVRVELMVMYGGVKNNYEHNVVVMNLPLCPQTGDDINVSLVNELQISNIQKLVTIVTRYVSDAYHPMKASYQI